LVEADESNGDFLELIELSSSSPKFLDFWKGVTCEKSVRGNFVGERKPKTNKSSGETRETKNESFFTRENFDLPFASGFVQNHG
jgi:hypothetical protein